MEGQGRNEENLMFLSSPPSDFTGPQVLSLQAKPWITSVSPFGKSFEEHLRVTHGLSKIEFDKIEEEIEGEDEETSAKYSSHRKKTVADLFVDNYYDLLGLGHLKWRASQADLKKAYREAVLVHHPDKQAQASKDSDDEIFKSIQKAYEVLSNPKSRKAYDSQEPFDDSIPRPEDVTSDEEFYGVFGPVFKRNEKWSIDPRCPALGDASTPIEKVRSFYNFWYSLKSWRDFSFRDEYDPDEAECREEKRWMERKNAKERAKMENDEQARLNSLIDMAYKLDPRVRLMKEQEAAEKEEIKRRRAEYKQKQVEELERAQQQVREREEQAQRRQQEKMEAEQRERTRIARGKKRKRQIIRQLARSFSCAESDYEYICENLDLDELSAVATEASEIPNPDKEVLENFFKDKVASFKAAQESQKVEALNLSSSPKQDENVVWTNEEIALLTKAVVKFPGGTRGRWEEIRQFIGGKKTVKQIIARVRTAQGTAPNSTTSPLAASIGSQGSEEKEKVTVTVTPQKPQQQTQTEDQPPPKDSSVWDPEEQKLLEEALKNYPASLGKERWTKIAAAVPGRSRRDCLERYKYLVSVIQQTK